MEMLSQQRRVLEAKMAAQQARDAQDAARAALKQMQLSGWKLGSDDHGRNYYYNNITVGWNFRGTVIYPYTDNGVFQHSP